MGPDYPFGIRVHSKADGANQPYLHERHCWSAVLGSQDQLPKRKAPNFAAVICVDNEEELQVTANELHDFVLKDDSCYFSNCNCLKISL